MSPIGNRIKKLRNSIGITQKEFSDVVGISHNYLSQIESGSRSPSSSLIYKISKEFGVDQSWLSDGKGELTLNKSHQKSLDRDYLKFVIQSVEEFLIQENFVLTPSKKAELIILIYDLFEEDRDSTNKIKEKIVKLSEYIAS